MCSRIFSTKPISFRKILRMAMQTSMDKVKENAEFTQGALDSLKQELLMLNNTYNKVWTQHLLDENIKLNNAVEQAKSKLIQLETKNGVKQIPVHKQLSFTSEDTFHTKPSIQSTMSTTKEKKTKGSKEKIEPTEKLPVDVGRLDLRVGKVKDVQKHPDADSLYVLKINCGDEKLRTVCSGLVQHVSIEELSDRLVLVLCNLKPVKMRGIVSEAMVMCASTADLVEVLSPPANCSPGEMVECEGYIQQPDAILNPKKKIFETVALDLHVNELLQACYKQSPFIVPGKGMVVSKTLKNSPVK